MAVDQKGMKRLWGQIAELVENVSKVLDKKISLKRLSPDRAIAEPTNAIMERLEHLEERVARSESVATATAQ